MHVRSRWACLRAGSPRRTRRSHARCRMAYGTSRSAATVWSVSCDCRTTRSSATFARLARASNSPTKSANMERRTFLRATAAALATLGCSASNSREHEEGDGEVSTSDELASLAKATAWINSPALTAASVRGRVVLVQFCTFTCVNWLRTLPYARAWAEKYRDAGLIVIGAHTPEFSFEHDLANVQRALRDMRVTYPIAVDNESAIWRGFGNQYWPALYLIDSA